MELITRLSRAYREGGFPRLAKSAYLRARPLLFFVPDVPVRHGPVKVGTRLASDGLFSINADIKLYEYALLEGLKANVRPGDRVLVVGCGEGVTATVAATLCGPAGTVIGYEGSLDQVHASRATLALNGADNVTIHHAIVGSAIGVYGEETSYGDVVPPDALPECDVLELDCEGAEIEILQSMPFRPRAILVETHGVFGAPTARVSELLAGLGYRVRDLGWAEPYLLHDCIKNDIRVLEATRPPAPAA